jgi:hypothetical protein
MRAHALDLEPAAMAEAAPPVRYEIRIRGLLSETLLAAFPNMSAEMHAGVTTLSGALPDQAALHGLLAQLEALGLELLDLRRQDA